MENLGWFSGFLPSQSVCRDSSGWTKFVWNFSFIFLPNTFFLVSILRIACLMKFPIIPEMKISKLFQIWFYQNDNMRYFTFLFVQIFLRFFKMLYLVKQRIVHQQNVPKDVSNYLCLIKDLTFAFWELGTRIMFLSFWQLFLWKKIIAKLSLNSCQFHLIGFNSIEAVMVYLLAFYWAWHFSLHRLVG